MTEPEEKDRWNALAEELGLPPQSASPPPPLPAAPEARATDVTQSLESSEPMGAAQERPPRGRGRRNASSVERVTETPAQSPSSGEPSEAAEVSGDDERPHRRRRVRGNKKTRKTSTSSAETAEAEGGTEDKPRRRRRRRGKKADKDYEAPSAEVQEEKVEEAPAEEPEPDEEEDEENEDFSNWNVPSWAEIIAGLYRPEH